MSKFPSNLSAADRCIVHGPALPHFPTLPKGGSEADKAEGGADAGTQRGDEEGRFRLFSVAFASGKQLDTQTNV